MRNTQRKRVKTTWRNNLETDFAMSEQELNSYRFSPDKDPTDEMLRQIMKEVAEEARASNKAAADAYLAQMRRNIVAKQAKWADRINSMVNGRK